MHTIQEKIARALILLTILFIGAILYRMLISPKLDGIKSMVKSLESIDSEINTFLGENAVDEGEQPEIALEKELEKLVLKIPSESDIPKIINQLLIQAGKGLKIDYELIDPQLIVKSGRYKRAPIKVAFTLPYSNFNPYLTKIEEMPEVIRIDNLGMQRLSGTSDHLKVNLLLSAFVMPQKGNEIISSPATEEALPEISKVNPFKPETQKKVVKRTLSRPSYSREKIPNFTLQGIMKGEFESAVINDQIVYVGGLVGGWRLIEVQDKSVVLKKGDRKITLRQQN